MRCMVGSNNADTTVTQRLAQHELINGSLDGGIDFYLCTESFVV